MSIANEIQRIKTNIQDAFDAVTDMGGTYTEVHSDNLADAITSIPQGGSGGYNIEPIDNSDGTQTLNITDADGEWSSTYTFASDITAADYPAAGNEATIAGILFPADDGNDYIAYVANTSSASSACRVIGRFKDTTDIITFSTRGSSGSAPNTAIAVEMSINAKNRWLTVGAGSVATIKRVGGVF